MIITRSRALFLYLAHYSTGYISYVTFVGTAGAHLSSVGEQRGGVYTLLGEIYIFLNPDDVICNVKRAVLYLHFSSSEKIQKDPPNELNICD